MHRLCQRCLAQLHGRDIDGDAGTIFPTRRFAAGLVEHEAAELVDEAALLRNRHELRRRDPAALRMVPAHQCLARGHFAGLQIDDRLIEDEQPVLALQRGAQLGFQPSAFLDAGFHGRAEQACCAPAGRLGGIERHVGA